MGSSQPSEEVTVSADGITVVKRFEEDEFPVPAIAFEFRSTREEPVTVRLRDAVPDGVAVEDLGFHPEYGSEYWTVDDGGISFEREFDAGAEYTTVYGIRATGTEDIEQFLVEPTIEAVDPPLPDGTAEADETETPEVDVVPGDQDAVKEAIAGEGAVPGLEDDGDGEPEEDAEPLDLEEPTAGTDGEDEASPEDAEGAEEADEGTGEADEGAEEADAAAGDDVDEEAEAAATADTRIKEDDEQDEPEPAIQEVAAGSAGQSLEGSLLAALADEIRDGDVDEEDLELLRETVEATGAVDGSTEARIQQLQRDVADLRAYTDALDEFLDENGTAQQVLEDARDRIDAFEDRLAEFGETVEHAEANAEEATATAREAEEAVGTLREEVDDIHAEVEDVHDDVDDLEEDLEDVQEDVDDVEAEVEGVRTDVEGVQTEVGEVQADVDGVEADVDDVETEVEGLRDDLESASASIEELEDRTASFEEELEEVKAEVHEGDLEGRVEEMESALQDLQEWQTQIKETFGGGG